MQLFKLFDTKRYVNAVYEALLGLRFHKPMGHNGSPPPLIVLLMRLGALYQHFFDTRPWATLIATNGTLTVIADALAQNLDRKKTTSKDDQQRGQVINSSTQDWAWDWHRSGRFLAFGSAVAPFLGEWNKFLEHRFPMRTNTGKLIISGLLRRVTLDQLFLYVSY